MADYEPISYWKLIFSAAISLNFVLSKCLVNWSTIIGSFNPVRRGLLNSSGRGKRLFSSPVWTLSELRRLSHRYKTKNSLKLGMTGAVMSPMLGLRHSSEEVEAIVNNNDKSLSLLAFAISPPGTAPNADAFKEFFPGQVGVTLATIKWLQLFIFQAHRLVVANIVWDHQKGWSQHAQLSNSCRAQPREGTTRSSQEL